MKLKICIVLANYYPKISKDLLQGSIKVLKKNKLNFKLFYAPGVFEIPVIISKKINTFDAFIALGCVIKGQTPHFHFISKATTNAIMDLSISHKKPVGNGIITCLNMKQAIIRANPKGKNKGAEATNAILKVLEV